jgi:hypothetical protein
MDRLAITTPYFWETLKYLTVALVVILIVETTERYGARRSIQGDFSLSGILRNIRSWRNAIAIYFLANSIAAISGGMGSIVLSYASGIVLIFTFFRTIDRECVLGEFARGGVRTAEATLYAAFVLALARDALFPNM